MDNNDNIIQFPVVIVPLNEDQQERFEYHKQKMKEASSKAGMDFYYNQAKIIVEYAKK